MKSHEARGSMNTLSKVPLSGVITVLPVYTILDKGT
jgi:hypothetical protein